MSGKKKAKEILKKVIPLWEQSNFAINIIETQYIGHAQEIVQAINLSEITVLVIIGGDGTVYEVINGLMNRSDWKTAIRTPLGIISGGTGNGLSKTILAISGEPYDPISSAFLIAKGKTRPLDIADITQKNRHYYSFLSLAWGLVSDVDLGSDRLRWIGSLKNDIYALLLIWRLRRYRGKLFVFVDPENSLKACQPLELCEACQKKNQSTNLPSATESLPSTWQVIEGEFILLWAMNIVWAAHNIKTAPYAHFSNGMMDILVLRGGLTRWQVLQAFLKTATGNHITLPYVEYYQVKGFRLEPVTQGGSLAIDGEAVNYSPLQMEILPGLARIICC
jgi:sphingosine kinase